MGRLRELGEPGLAVVSIVRAAAQEAALHSVVVLGLMVLIRTYLSWALVVEIEGRWPWQLLREEWQA